MYRKVASDLQRRDKGLVGLAAGVERRGEATPLRPDGLTSRPPVALRLLSCPVAISIGRNDNVFSQPLEHPIAVMFCHHIIQ
jgi:hypothetical protein